ncbi:phosphoglycolate phosphatase, bacterial [Aureimonas sp. SA4125]|uniref:HAD hydrolase-like protein n=1 Tax=Aureimonas sp. SA4125 TaxID=2826993 RepID=UPI001CC5E9C7|nr:HAD hydrolase-like protein [Aureimonas sp. SA4125]BDA84022.1 phosphoglycolate phosphatase, bacterial [Aureimonas sp. SA4125]
MSASFSAKGAREGQCIVFDLDGTLVETAPDLLSAANRALIRAGFQATEPALLRPQISHGARAIVVEALRHQEVPADAGLLDALERDLVADYSANIAAESLPYPGVVDVLDTLRADGAILAVCTNKRLSLAMSLLEALKLDGYFAAICGGDSFAFRKPHRDHLLMTIGQAGGSPVRAVMIGDSEVDVATAQAAAVPAIVMTYGYSAIDVTTLGADVVLDSFAVLPAAIDLCLSAHGFQKLRS